MLKITRYNHLFSVECRYRQGYFVYNESNVSTTGTALQWAAQKEHHTMQQRQSLVQRMRTLRRAERNKWNRFTWSGLLIIAVGVALIGYGISLHTGAYSVEGIAIVFGALIVIAGIIRVLIGVINPASPDDLLPYEVQEREQQEHQGTIDEELFS